MSLIPSQPPRPSGPTPPRTVVLPRQRSNARTEGRDDAFAEPRPVVAARIAAMRDCAETHHDPAAQRWADEYAFGALATWRALDTLRADLAAFEARS